MSNLFFPLLVALVLSGCATVPQSFVSGYSGPSAKIYDFSHNLTGSKAMACFVDQIDGIKVEETSASNSRGSSMGTGFRVNTRIATREIKATPTTIRLVATHMTGAPIHEIASRLSGQFLSIEKQFRFAPKASVEYAVRCTLTPEKQDVWIVDLATNDRVELVEVK
jgi:hypothetical protein